MIDGIADDCDDCVNEAANDADEDGQCGDVDQCEGFDDNIDTDDDGIADSCDIVQMMHANDADDGVCGEQISDE